MKTPQLVKDDPWLEPYINHINHRIAYFKDHLNWVEKHFGSLKSYSSWHEEMGFHYDKQKKGWWYREWAPSAERLQLIGDFNDWNGENHSLEKKEFGRWEIFIADSSEQPLQHGQRVKVRVKASNGTLDRIPAFIRYAVQDPISYDFSGQIHAPKQSFKWSDSGFSAKKIASNPIIYEAHVGMAQEKEGIGSYREFADQVLPRIKALGYNCVQLMAVMEHPYYGSFGYHVSNFFAPSSRFGSPEDLKYLVNKTHEMGMAVIMDIVHSHAVKNIAEGLNHFDGTEYQYFHAGGKGIHPQWDSLLFDYSKPEVQRFLLSNVRYWLEEFHFDGYRFDGITSMLYFHHGNTGFDHYDKYFVHQVDHDAILYLQMANEVVKETKAEAISIAEDMSGMPGLCRKIQEGGMGFDFRLGMGIPDFWIKYLKEKRDEDWDIFEMWSTMVNRRYKEGTIAYAESHDQAIVGDKTVAFWLMDKEMYWHMSKSSQNIIIDRGIALHKMIRIFTMALGGEAYLNFIGNEFGHPEWIDFPREGNEWSYKYARRQWSLVDNKELKYHYLSDFDQAMIDLISKYQVLAAAPARQLNMDATNKTIIFERAGLIFIFNFHPTNSIFDYRFWVPEAGEYHIVLNSDDAVFGGFDRVKPDVIHHSIEEEGENYLQVYNTNRTVLILKRKDK